MADRYSYSVGGVSIANGLTGKCLVGVTTPSTVRADLLRWQGETNTGAVTDDPVLFRLMRTSAGGTATSRTARKGDTAAPTSLVIPKDTYTVDATLTDEIDRTSLPAAGGGTFDKPFVDGRLPKVPVSTDVVIAVNTGGQTRVLGGEIEWFE